MLAYQQSHGFDDFYNVNILSLDSKLIPLRAFKLSLILMKPMKVSVEKSDNKSISPSMPKASKRLFLLKTSMDFQIMKIMTLLLFQPPLSKKMTTSKSLIPFAFLANP